MANKDYSRRKFIHELSLAAGASTMVTSLASWTGHTNVMQQKKLGIALVGLGSYSTGQLAPALQETKDCYLAGIVTGTPAKATEWSQRYRIPEKNIYNYQDFDKIAGNKDIDIVYVVLPIAMHKEFTVRAAAAGKHVICEKPMALNVAECNSMIEACRKANKLLSIGYRLHFEPYNREMMRLGTKKVYGKVKRIDCGNGFVYGGDPNAWRLKKSLAGGGGMMDMGIYAIQGARYVTGMEPLYVTATEEKTKPELFREVDETIYFELEFADGIIAKGKSSYNANINHLKATAEKGWFELSQAYRYGGMAGATSDGPLQLPQINQQAAQMDDFAQCIKNGKQTRVPGEEGLRDIKVIEAIYKSIASGKREKV
ncbi:MAG TPA: Gfo/Idh/MocA family oxidoreductase [Flavitalea sp.]|nr:Gfo/Idh/MocA family oxidoreductase [Flavitalea sp.]